MEGVLSEIMSKEKTWQVLIKESFTKTQDERYAESTKNEKILYWITILNSVCLYIFTLKPN